MKDKKKYPYLNILKDPVRVMSFVQFKEFFVHKEGFLFCLHIGDCGGLSHKTGGKFDRSTVGRPTRRTN